MFSKKRIIDIFLISLLLSVNLCASLFNFFSEGMTNESFAATFIFIALWALAVSAAFLFRHRAVTFFIFGYLSFTALSITVLMIASAMESSGNAFLILCSLAASAFGGFFYISENGSVIALAVALIGAAISLLLSLKIKKEN